MADKVLSRVLSEESVFLVQNWDTVDEILRAEKKLRAELSRFQASLRDDFARCPWWSRDWMFDRWQDAQIYVLRQSWQKGGQAAVVIGLDGIAPDRVFGDGDAPYLFVWARDEDLARRLAKHLAAEDKLIGEVARGKSRFSVKETVRKCLPEDVADYWDSLRAQTLEFVTFYVELSRQLDPLITEHLAR